MNKIVIGIYNNISNRSPEYQQRVSDITHFWTDQLAHFNFTNNIGPAECLEGSSVDELLRTACGKAEFIFLVSYGQTIKSPSMAKAIFDLAIEKKAPLIAHVLDRKSSWYGFHHQCFLLNLEVWDKLGRPSFYPAESPIEVPAVERSRENIHDDYTPLWIRQASEMTESVSASEEGSQILSSFLQAGFTVHNIPAELRKHKDHFYPDDGMALEDHLLKEGNLPLTNICQIRFLGETSIENEAKRVYLFNTEGIHIHQDVERKPIDNMFCVAAGLKPIILLHTFGFHAGTNVICFDFSPAGLRFKKYLLESWDGTDYKKTVEKFFSFEENKSLVRTYHMYYSFEENEKRYWKDHFSSEEEWIATWKRYRELPHKFVHLNLLKDYKQITELLQSKCGQSNLMWWSNCFHMDSALRYLGKEGLYSTRRKILADFANADPNLLIDSCDPFSFGINPVSKMN